MKKLRAVFFILCFVPQLSLTRGKKDQWANLSPLRSGQKIEVVDLQSRSLQGTFLSFSEERILLRVGQDEVPVQRANVLRVVLRQPRRLRNAAIAAAIGVGAGLAIAMPVWTAEGATASPGILGPLIGGSAGAGIGATVPLRSRTIYRVKKPRSNAP